MYRTARAGKVGPCIIPILQGGGQAYRNMDCHGGCRKNQQHRSAFADLDNGIEVICNACNIEDPRGKPSLFPRNDLFREKLESVHTANRTKGPPPLTGQ